MLTLLPAAIFAGLVAGGLSLLWERHLGARTLPLKIGAVFVPGTAAGLAYWLTAFWLRVPAATEITGLVLKKWRR